MAAILKNVKCSISAAVWLILQQLETDTRQKHSFY